MPDAHWCEATLAHQEITVDCSHFWVCIRGTSVRLRREVGIWRVSETANCKMGRGLETASFMHVVKGLEGSLSLELEK